MKKLAFAVLQVMLQAGIVFAQETLSTAITAAGRDFGNTIPPKSRVLVLHIASPTEALRNYLISRLTGELARNPLFSVVEDRNRPALGQYKLKLDGELSDTQTRTIAGAVGVQAAITGAVTVSGNTYILKLQAVSQTGGVLLSRSYQLRADKTLTDLLKPATPVPAPAPVLQPTPAPAPTAQPTTAPAPAPAPAPVVQAATDYKIGDTGPAGGLIFYVKDNNAGGWRYLEAAPAYTEKRATFADKNYKGSTVKPKLLEGFGAGKQNTENLASMLLNNGEWDRAAQICGELEVNGFDDWYLPSFNELSMMYGNLKRKGLGSFRDEAYWSSNGEVEGEGWSWETFNPWRFNFVDGVTPKPATKMTENLYVRAVRQF
jgi:hypothetical protein